MNEIKHGIICPYCHAEHCWPEVKEDVDTYDFFTETGMESKGEFNCPACGKAMKVKLNLLIRTEATECCESVSIEHMGYRVTQSSYNHHISIKDASGVRVFHTPVDEPKTEEQLKEYVCAYLELAKSLDAYLAAEKEAEK